MAAEQRQRRIYGVDEYSQEVIAVAFAKTSRSPEPFDVNLKELSGADAAKFHEKWVVGYGHASVAEHAVLHIAFEAVSRLAADQIEANRLASYTEKSTRFQRWDSHEYYTPYTVTQSGFAEEYRDAHTELFQVYAQALASVGSEVKKRYPPREGESDEKHDTRVRTTYVDRCRFLLPASALADLGMTANARVWEEAISKWLSSNLREVREIGGEAKLQALTVAPTLVKYAKENPYLIKRRKEFANSSEEGKEEGKPNVKLINFDPKGEEKILAALLYQARGRGSFEDCVQDIRSMDDAQRKLLLDSFYGDMSSFDKPGREFELANLTFDVTMDWASYRDFWRNRMLTPIPQPIDGNLGFAIPQIIHDVGIGDKVNNVLTGAIDLANMMKSWSKNDEYLYLYPNATLRRMLMHFNLRELVEFWKIRGAANTNPAYRMLALQMGELATQAYPALWKYAKSKGGEISSREVEEDFYGR